MIRLAELGYDCVGVDLDASMLAVARRQAPGLPWFRIDLAEFEPDPLGIAGDFDLVVAAGNIFPLLAPGPESAVVERLSAALRPGGLLVAGFGRDAVRCRSGTGRAPQVTSTWTRVGATPAQRPRRTRSRQPRQGPQEAGHKPMDSDNHQVMHGINLLLRHPAGALEELFTCSWSPEPGAYLVVIEG